MSQYSRRTVVRGAAWSIPVVAVAANAPAFAASTNPPSVAGYTGCKTPGDPNGANCQGYLLNLTFNVDAPYTWTVVFQSIKVDTVDFTGQIQPTTTFEVSSVDPTVTFRICTDRSPGPIDLDLTYTASAPGVSATTIVAPTAKLKLSPC